MAEKKTTNNSTKNLQNIKKEKVTKNPVVLDEVIYLLPLRNAVLFPRVILPIVAYRDNSFELLKKAFDGKLTIGVITQKDALVENPEAKDLYGYGTLIKINNVSDDEDNSRKGVIEGIRRFKIEEYIEFKPFVKAKVKYLDDKPPKKSDTEYKALVDSIRETVDELMEVSQELYLGLNHYIETINNNDQFINFLCSALDLTTEQKIELLELSDIKTRTIRLLAHLIVYAQRVKVKEQINSKVQHNLSKSQREFYLQEQVKEIQKELGNDPSARDIKELIQKAKNKKWSSKIQEVFDKEIERLQRTNQMSPEYGVQLAYLNTLLDLPWNFKTKDIFDLKRAKEILDRDHYGLEKVKDRILEYLAVLKLKGDLKTPIICLVGPPGVGKTSLGKSVAEALNRKYIRMSLGGLHDEAEIRGHRRTYIGAMPGRIIQSLRKVKTSNPVFVLDEIDKIGSDFHGDPASALLEVLDPEQNNTFFDNYIELEYDLSNIMFIATANTLSSIHPALLDRMEIIDMTGYLIEEKIEIAKRHLITKQLESHGVKNEQCVFNEDCLKFLIENYTRESGVRELDKKIASVVRKRAKEIAFEMDFIPSINRQKIIEFLGSQQFIKNIYEDLNIPGIATGLAWTAVGGEILTLEATANRGNGRLSITGNLGKVMTESTTLAYEYIKSHYDLIKIHPLVFKYWDIHVHAPEGAIPKDGPSAGITITTALASLFTQRKLKPYLAMTGEITLSGRVLPVGGIKEKILAARRAGVKTVILPEKNKNDVDDIKQTYLEGLDIVYVKTMDEVISLALSEQKVENARKIAMPSKKKNKKS